MSPNRRGFLVRLAAFLGALMAGRVRPARAAEPPWASDAAPYVSPSPPTEPVGEGRFRDRATGMSLTRNEAFYTVRYSDDPLPRVDRQGYRLRVQGLVERELSFDLAALKARPAVRQMRTLECISNPPGGNLISNATWRGVRLRDLLEEAGVRPGAVELKLTAADGYHTSIPLELALDPHSLLVYEMNGQALPLEHGYPIRCLWSGRYGQKQPKWLTEIELVAEPHLGFWERRGWSNEAVIQPNARIEAPAEGAELRAGWQRVAGVAYADGSGVARVEVSTDDGRSWRRVGLRRNGPLVWTEWRLNWQASPGEAVLLARVTDGSGRRQEGRARGFLDRTFPDGSAAMHWIRTRVG